jgi:Uma2 family endonuclease
MNQTSTLAPPRLDLNSNGIRLTPEEFDAVDDYDDNYLYELVNGVVIVTPIADEGEAGPVDYLGHLLTRYQEDHPNGRSLNATLPNRYVQLPNDRRIADRVIWAGLGHMPDPAVDLPTIAIEFVSKRKRDQLRDYIDKRREYMEVGVKEYWIIDRFKRTMTVVKSTPTGIVDEVIPETGTYSTPLLPGFVLPLARILTRSDDWA